jgi:alpha-D-xyloside xylohydrolase
MKSPVDPSRRALRGRGVCNGAVRGGGDSARESRPRSPRQGVARGLALGALTIPAACKGASLDVLSPGQLCSAVEAGDTAGAVNTYVIDADGVTFSLPSARMRVQVCKEDILRVQYATGGTFPAKTSLSVNASWGTPTFCVSDAGGVVTIATARVKAKVDTATGRVTYTDLADHIVLAEAEKSLTPVEAEGIATKRVETAFDSPKTEALFGLGQHPDGVMNRKGTDQHIFNTDAQSNVPVLVSNRGYGIYWDNYSTSDFHGAEAHNTRFRYVSEAGDMVDYYFFYGPSLDRVVALYRIATGAAPMLPKWAYGLFQSKDRYQSQDELLAVKDGYRKNGIPIDSIAQDWYYWTPYAWGSHYMDESRYPDPASLVTQMHDANVHAMISVWPLYEHVNTQRKADELDDYNALDRLGALYPSTTSTHFYDVFNAAAGTLVYRQMNDRLVMKYGWDAIWVGNGEPVGYPSPVDVRAVDTALGKGLFYVNAYPLQHAKALYEGWRNIGQSQKRVYTLTRGSFAGQQRYSATCWSGDIACDFPTLTKQIPAGLNFALAGMPYWTTDIGGYFGHNVDWSAAANNELFTRWFQFGAFCPMFRIHGGGSRELYGDQWSPATKANLLAIDNLRYRLMPYIYSLAWKVTSEGYTIMRHLVFDYPTDTNVFELKDQFLFGPSLLVNPVVAAGVTKRAVYFPAGRWYDFWSGSAADGGKTSVVDAPLSRLPLFVKAGSILPMGPTLQFATQSIDPLEVRIYEGADGAFSLHEDEGDSYDYESGGRSRIDLKWNDAAHELTIGAREGSYTGMPQRRTFNIVWVGSDHGVGVDVTVSPDRVIAYDGAEVVVGKNR